MLQRPYMVALRIPLPIPAELPLRATSQLPPRTISTTRYNHKQHSSQSRKKPTTSNEASPSQSNTRSELQALQRDIHRASGLNAEQFAKAQKQARDFRRGWMLKRRIVIWGGSGAVALVLWECLSGQDGGMGFLARSSPDVKLGGEKEASD